MTSLFSACCSIFCTQKYVLACFLLILKLNMLLYLTTLLVWAHYFIVLHVSKQTREFTSEVCSWTRFQCVKFFITIWHFRFLLFPFHKIKFSYNKLFLLEVLWITSISDNIHTHYINKSLEIWYRVSFFFGGGGN